MMAAADEVRAANDAFYGALKQYVHGKAGPMLALWWTGGPVTKCHPLRGWSRGWDAVHACYTTLDMVYEESEVAVEDVSIHVHGDFAYAIGIERIVLTLFGRPTTFLSPVTNIFREVDGSWKVIHHHVGRSAELQKIFEELYDVR